MPGGRALIDTSVAVGLGDLNPASFSTELAISALTLAELATGPHATGDDSIRALRQLQIQAVEANVETLPFDPSCARAYGPVYAAAMGVGRKPRGARAIDLMIAATALARDLPLWTRNAKDLRGLDGLIEIVDVSA